MFISFNSIYDNIKELSSASKDLAEMASNIKIADGVFFALLLVTVVLIISLVIVRVKKLKPDNSDDLTFALIIFVPLCIGALMIRFSFKDDYLSAKEKYENKSKQVTDVAQKNNVDTDNLVKNVDYLLSVYDEYSSKYESLESNVNGNCSGKTLNFDTSDKDFQTGIGLLKLGKYPYIDIVLNKFYNDIDILNYPELYDGDIVKFNSYDDCISFRENEYKEIDNLEDVLNSSEFGYNTVVGNLKK